MAEAPEPEPAVRRRPSRPPSSWRGRSSIEGGCRTCVLCFNKIGEGRLGVMRREEGRSARPQTGRVHQNGIHSKRQSKVADLFCLTRGRSRDGPCAPPAHAPPRRAPAAIGATPHRGLAPPTTSATRHRGPAEQIIGRRLHAVADPRPSRRRRPPRRRSTADGHRHASVRPPRPSRPPPAPRPTLRRLRRRRPLQPPRPRPIQKACRRCAVSAASTRTARAPP